MCKYATLIAVSYVASLVMGACGSKPNEDACKKFADHFSELMLKGQEGPNAEVTKQVTEGMKPQLIKDCLEKGLKTEVECTLKSTSMDELEKCSAPKTK